MVENTTSYIMIRSLSLLLAALLGYSASAQNIFIDEDYADWSDAMLLMEDTNGDGPANGIDIGKVWAANDQEYFYLRIEVGKDINIQSNNELTLYIDADNDLQTGRKINGIGAELEWIFGERDGTLYLPNGDELFLQHEDIDLMSSPTVSSSQFEIAMRRSAFVAGFALDLDGTITIRLEDNGTNGDDIPNSIGGMTYTLGSTTRDFHNYDISKPADTDLRVLTLNVLDDNLFDPLLFNAFRRQLALADPDVIALQEVRSFTSSETQSIIQQMLPGQWFHNKSSFGNVVLLSRFPILQDEGMNGNEAHLIDVNGQEVVVINMHLPCCNNDVDRQQEVDNMMAFVRDLRTDANEIRVATNTPIIILGDSNLVGNSQQQQTLLTGDIQNVSQHGPAFAPDWDGSELEDAKPLATGTPYSKTWYNRSGSFSSGRLDYIIYTGSVLWLQNTFVISTRDMTTADRNAYGVNFSDSQIASDHLPTVADFSFTSVSTVDTDIIDVQLYPNPVADVLTVTAAGKQLTDVVIYDPTGQTVLRASHGSNIDVSALGSGVYTVSGMVGKTPVVRKFAKM